MQITKRSLQKVHRREVLASSSILCSVAIAHELLCKSSHYSQLTIYRTFESQCLLTTRRTRGWWWGRRAPIARRTRRSSSGCCCRGCRCCRSTTATSATTARCTRCITRDGTTGRARARGTPGRHRPAARARRVAVVLQTHGVRERRVAVRIQREEVRVRARRVVRTAQATITITTTPSSTERISQQNHKSALHKSYVTQ